MKNVAMSLCVVVGFVAGCGSNDSAADASVPDGGCAFHCPPAAECAPGCQCPGNFIPAAPSFFRELMRADLAELRGLTTGIGTFVNNGTIHALLVAFDPATVPVGTDIVLAADAPPYIGFGFDVDPLMNIRSAFLATEGTLHLSRACGEGVAGTLTEAVLKEIDIFASLTPIDGGCTLIVPSVQFAIAHDCGANPDLR